MTPGRSGAGSRVYGVGWDVGLRCCARLVRAGLVPFGSRVGLKNAFKRVKFELAYDILSAEQKHL